MTELIDTNNVTPLFKGIDRRTAPTPANAPAQIIDSMKRIVKASENVLTIIDDGTFFDHKNEESISKTVVAMDELEAAHNALKELGF